MKNYDKSDIEVGALAITDKWKWERVLSIGSRVETLRKKEEAFNKKAAALIKEIMADPEYKQNYKKVKKYYKEKYEK